MPDMPALMGVHIVASGSSVPAGVVSNAQLKSRFGCDPDAILRDTGIRERRHVLDSQATSDLCVEASRRCLEMAGRAPAEVDLVLTASVTPDMSFPSVACMVQDRLRMNCAAVDLQSAGAGFLYALVTGAAYVASKASDLCLVLGGDCPSRFINPNDVKAMSLFGDGAGAVLLARGRPDEGILGFHLATCPAGQHGLRRPGCGSRLPPSDEVLAQGLHFLVTDATSDHDPCHVIQAISACLDRARLRPADVDWCVLQHGNSQVQHAIGEALAIEPRRLVNHADRFGDALAGAMPIALDQLLREQQLEPGQRVLLVAHGPGTSIGTILLSW